MIDPLRKLSIEEFIPSASQVFWENLCCLFLRDSRPQNHFPIFIINYKYNIHYEKNKFKKLETSSDESLLQMLEIQKKNTVFTFLGPLVEVSQDCFLPLSFLEQVAINEGYTMTFDSSGTYHQVLFSK